MNTLKIFNGTSNVELASGIASNLSIGLGKIYHHNFPSGESYCQFKENIRGADVFLIQSISSPANENLMQLLVMSDAARRASAERITAVVPYFGYARQDRKDKSRVPISAKLVLDLMEAAGIDRVITMDLHSPQVGGFTNLPFDHLSFEPILINYIKTKYHSLALRDRVIIMAPDVGALKRVEKYASQLKCDFGFISKKRIGDEQVELQSLSGDVKDKYVIIIDDLTESAGTLIQAASACKKNGAKHVICAVTHGCFSETAMTRLSEALPHPDIRPIGVIDEFIHSNTVDIHWTLKYKPDGIKCLDVSDIFAKAIQRTHNNESVSELFV
jgi:ribose-phosphate pyrophosphokinase